ncbi:MAG: amidohydrolase [Planctomycetota bacterium]|nr:MAG: amidohydrolase [Planctomycetota bacterium]
MRPHGLSPLILFLALAVPAAAADERPRAFVGARLIPIDGEEIEKGVLVVEGGKIAAVGAEGEVDIPADAEKIDVEGKVIMPGLICTHSHIGGSGSLGGADGSGPIQPGVRIYDSLDVHDSGFKRAVAGGLTTLNIMPGSGHLISGQTVYVKLRLEPKPAKIEAFFIRGDNDKPLGGLKMANGTNSMRDPPFPGTRGKSAYLVREQYIKAREYHDKIVRAEGDAAKMPPRDLNLEALVEAMQGKRIVHHHTHRHDDIMTVLRLSKEFQFPVVLHHVSDGWKVADEIADAKAPCSVIVIDSPGGKLEARYCRFETGAILEEAGVNVAFHTDDWITDSRVFRRSAALAVRAGMSRAGALRALTLAGAEMLDLDDRIGSLTVGKDADFAVLEGDPLSVYCKTLETYVDGTKVFDRSDPKDYLYAVGGYGAGHDQYPYMCCFDDAQLLGGGK